MRTAGTALLYLAAVAGGTYVGFRPTIDSGFARVQTDIGDTVLNHYLLEHTWRVVADPRYPGTLLSPPFFFPEPLVLGYSENFLGAAPIYWGLRLGLDPGSAFGAWMILTNALNFVAFAVVARWFGCNHLLAALGGYLWAFASVHIYQYGHQQMIPRFWMPVAAYHAWHLAAGPNLRSLNRMLACVFLQATCCFYTGWFLAAGLLVLVPVAAAQRPGGLRELFRFARSNPWRVAGRLLGWGGATVGFFSPYLIANRGVARAYSDCLETLPNLSSWLTGPPGGWWSATLAPILMPVSEEAHLFCGFGLYALMAGAAAHAWLSRSEPGRDARLAFVWACLLTSGVWCVLTFNLAADVSGWWLVRFLPGGRAIRCVSRVYVVVYLLGGLAVLVWLQLLADRIREDGRRVLFLAAVAAVVVFEQTGHPPASFDRAEFYPLAARCGEAMKGADAAYVIIRERPEYWYRGELLAMWAGMEADVPVVNGYSGRTPAGRQQAESLTDDEIRAWLAGRFRGRLAVVDPLDPKAVRYLVIE